jgi:hypothetical protein
MTDVHKAFPDMSDVLAQKEQRRWAAATRSFGEKIAIVEVMRERLAPLKLARQARERRAAANDGVTRNDGEMQ